jgi:hypothetical protein
MYVNKKIVTHKNTNDYFCGYPANQFSIESSSVKAREKSHLKINDDKCLLVYLLFILCERRNGEVLICVLVKLLSMKV